MAALRRLAAAGGSIALLLGGAFVGSVAGAEDIEAGRQVAESLCAGCHAIGGQGPSPVAAAPPFTVVVTRWPPAHLAEALAEGITVGHSEGVRMPEFRLDAEDADSLIAYLEDLKPR